MTDVGLPQLVRPNRAIALEYAKHLFGQGDRVDMQVLATSLGVGRTTIYRWLGDRESVLATILAELGEFGWTVANEEATGVGIDRVLDVTRRYMRITSEFEPLTTFARREPEVALRILLSEQGAVAQMIRAGLRGAVDRELPEVSDKISDGVIDVLVQLGTALEWAPIVIGEEPAIDRAIELARTVIANAVGS